MKTLTTLAAILLVVGGLIWGLVALFEFDLVAAIAGLEFGETNAVSRIVYGLVGISAVVLAARLGDVAGESREGHRGHVGRPATEA